MAADSIKAKQVNPCLLTMDDTKLDAVIACFYKPGARFNYPGPFELLSRESARLLNKAAHVDLMTDFVVATSKLVSNEVIGKQRYARASVQQTRGECLVTSTQTWIQEDGHWRLVWFPTVEYLAQQQDTADKVLEMQQTLDEWLTEDPYAFFPMEQLISILQSGPDLVKFKMLPALPVSRHGSADQLIQRALAGNPDDDLAIGIAIRSGPALKVAQAAFARVPKASCVRSSHVSFMLKRYTTAGELKRFLAEAGDESETVVTSAILKLIDLNDPGALQGYLTDARSAQTRAAWQKLGQERLGRNCAMVAGALSNVPKVAKSWLDCALAAAPDDAIVKSFIRGLRPPK